MISVEKSLYYGEKQTHVRQCKCGSHQFWHATLMHTLKISIFSILPLRDQVILKCSKCQREYPSAQSDRQKFVRPGFNTRMTQFMGWPFIVVIGLLISTFYQSINPDDTLYRVQPKVGDIYFVDYYQITKDYRHATHPYRIAKLVSFSDNELELKVSSWSHSKKWGVLSDFSTQMYAYKSNYIADPVTLDWQVLHSSDEVFSIRRKRSYVDVEETQKRTEFRKRFADLPFVD